MVIDRLGAGVGVEVDLLGEIAARVRGAAVDVGAAKQRCVLAALAVDLGRVVPDEQLIGRVWGVRPPARVANTLASYVSRLRKVFKGTGTDIVRRSGGFVLLGEDLAVDLRRFGDLCDQARGAGGERAVELLSAALALCAGEALTGVDGEWAAEERARLGRLRFAAECDLADARLRVGSGLPELLTALSTRVLEHPVDERVAGQYMLALHRAGRPTDALAHFERLRARLAEELGCDPGPALRKLHEHILTDDPALSPHQGVARQLPARPAPFSGRDADLAELDAALGGGGTAVIAGTGGIGKTWLALHWAHRELCRFPDGQLFVDLRGFSPDEAPMSPDVAMRGFLEALGTPADRVPTDPHARAALFRSQLAGRRMLLVLDNAVDSAQVVPLLPGSDTCAVLVTSRAPLLGLVTGHAAHPVAVAALPETEARSLLVDRLGARRVADDDGAAADEIVELCGGLPLALSIIAGRARIRPRTPLADLAAELRDTGLGALDDEDPTASLPKVLSWSYRLLTPAQASAFELLGAAPGVDIGLPAAASLLGVAPADATTLLRGLEQASLLSQDAPGRYRMHDLLRQYARTAGSHDARPALRRVAEFYLHSAWACERMLAAHRRPVVLPARAALVRPTQPADEAHAMRWFAAEHANVLAVQQWAARTGMPAVVWPLAWALDTHHFRLGRTHDALACWTLGVEAADQVAATADRALAHRCLGQAHGRLGDLDGALRHLGTSLTLAQRAHDDRVEADTRRIIAWTLGEQGRLAEALEHLERLRESYRALGEPVLEADMLNATGVFHSRLGQYAQARERCTAALRLFRLHDHGTGIADAHASLGLIAHHTGDFPRALHHHRLAIAGFEALEIPYQAADVHEAVGDTRAALGDAAGAARAWQRALGMYEAQGRDQGAADLRRRMADARATTGP